MPVPIYDPGRVLVRVPALRPSPQQVPEDIPNFPKRRTRFDVTVIVSPTSDNRIKLPNQVLLFCGAIRANLTTYLFQEGVQVLLGGRNQELAAILAQVLSEEVEALFDMRDAGFLR